MVTEEGRVFSNPTTIESVDGTTLHIADADNVDVKETLQMFVALSKMRYIGAFRNAVNVGENEDYYDMKTGQSFIREWHARHDEPARAHPISGANDYLPALAWWWR